jgi:hypothetical protein
LAGAGFSFGTEEFPACLACLPNGSDLPLAFLG